MGCAAAHSSSGAALDLNALINAADSIRTPPPNGAYGGNPYAMAYAQAGGWAAGADLPCDSNGGYLPAQNESINIYHDGGGRRASADSAGLMGATSGRPRRQLLSRGDTNAGAGNEVKNDLAEPSGRRRPPSKAAAARAAAVAAAENLPRASPPARPLGLQVTRAVLRPWAHTNAQGAIRVIRREKGDALLSKHPGVPNVLTCMLHTPSPIVTALAEGLAATAAAANEPDAFSARLGSGGRDSFGSRGAAGSAGPCAGNGGEAALHRKSPQCTTLSRWRFDEARKGTEGTGAQLVFGTPPGAAAAIAIAMAQ
mmetsp:Transcript_26603/g.62193  ORF Transcript_26603/g.62193 Transcript_26603/m.62193 type:complete len:312 (+) Transcript_26603:1-936(+)